MSHNRDTYEYQAVLEKGYHHICGKNCYQSKKRSYGGKRSELNFYQNEPILSIYDCIFIIFSYAGNLSNKIKAGKMASFTQQLFQS